ncbi:MAG: AAA family ATPase [Pirellulales bacterium]|nr:AAA family ATPase [Pirellulales bacterium]
MTNSDGTWILSKATRPAEPAGWIMYEQHLAMACRPFKAAPDVARYFPAGAIDEARQRIALCLERGDGLALVIGPPGTGKTLLLAVIAETYRERMDVVFVPGATFCTRRALLQMILHRAGLPYANLQEGELRLALLDRLQRSDDDCRRLLLLMDEAQGLPLKLLEELRMLTNVTRQGSPSVQIVLAGPARLDERLAGPQLELLQHRVAARCYLEPFDCHETKQYIRSQLTASGAKEALFGEEAMEAVYRATDGVPRLINQLCDHALLLTAIAEQDSVSGEIVDEAWCDLQQLPSPVPSEITTATSHDSVVEFGSLNEIGAEEMVEREESVGHGSMPEGICDPSGMSFDEEEVIEDRFSKMPVTTGAKTASIHHFAESAAMCNDDENHLAVEEDELESEENEIELPKLDPVPLVVQPDVDYWNTDPVYPESEPIQESVVSSPRLEVVGMDESGKDTSHVAALPTDKKSTAGPTSIPLPSAPSPRFGQLFASLRRG